MGVVIITSFLRKHNIDGNVSTKDELIGVGDALPQIMWSKYFVEVQGYTV